MVVRPEDKKAKKKYSPGNKENFPSSFRRKIIRKYFTHAITQQHNTCPRQEWIDQQENMFGCIFDRLEISMMYQIP